MDVRRVRLGLWYLTGVSAFASLLVVGHGLSAGYSLPSPIQMKLQPSLLAGPSHQRIPELNVFEPLFAIELRRPLLDSAPPTTSSIAAKQSSLRVRVVGTIVEPGRSVAMLVNAEGKLELKKIGESSGGAEVIGIEADAVVVRYNGGSLTLRTERKKVN